jgi:hypothetical protein
MKNSNDTVGGRTRDLPAFSLGHHVVTGSGICSASRAKSTVNGGFGGGRAQWLTHVSVLAEYSVTAPPTHLLMTWC